MFTRLIIIIIITVFYFYIGKLTLKIPWKRLYTDPVIASVDTLYLLVVPNQDIKYDAAKEEKYLQEAKLAEIKKVEEAKRIEAEKGKYCIVFDKQLNCKKSLRTVITYPHVKSFFSCYFYCFTSD